MSGYREEKELRERQRALRKSIAARSSKSSAASSGVDLAATSTGSSGVTSGHGATNQSSASSVTEPHALTFRVMRLCKPVPSKRPSLLRVDPGETLGPLPDWEGEGCPCGIGASVVLPQSFGSIYAGEEFRAFVCVYNRADKDAALVNISLEIHLNDKLYHRAPRADDDMIAIFGSKATQERLIESRLSETGVHVLVCMAEYTDHLGHVRHLRQYFRFNVMAPLKFSVSVVPVDDEPPEEESRVRPLVAPTRFVVVLKLTNASQGPMKFIDVSIEPTSGYEISAIEKRGNGSSSEDSEPSYGRIGCGPGDAESFCFLATALQNDGRSAEGAGPGKTIGRPRVRWRAVGGQEGVLDKVGIVAEPPGRLAELEVTIEAVPRRIVVQKPFLARCRVRNNTETSRRLYLQVRRDKVGEVVPVGVSGQNLGEVPGMSMLETSLRMLPLTAGRHRVSGVRVVDIDSRASFSCEPMEGPEVLVFNT